MRVHMSEDDEFTSYIAPFPSKRAVLINLIILWRLTGVTLFNATVFNNLSE